MFTRITNLSLAQLEDLYQMYQLQWWSRGRQLADIQRMLSQCDEIVAFCDRDSKHLVAFCRILTDYIYRAVIFDVIVHQDYRDRGLGRLLLDTIANDPGLQKVEAIELHCVPELIPFYEKWNFTPSQLRLMTRKSVDSNLQ